MWRTSYAIGEVGSRVAKSDQLDEARVGESQVALGGYLESPGCTWDLRHRGVVSFRAKRSERVYFIRAVEVTRAAESAFGVSGRKAAFKRTRIDSFRAGSRNVADVSGFLSETD
jgi:hypothetical protein